MSKQGNIEDEFQLIQQAIQQFQAYRREVVVPNGDDAAIYLPSKGMGQVICVDTMVEDIHFNRRTMSPFQIGYKCLAVNLSDIAAMGGIPTYMLISLVVAPQWSAAEIIEIYKGMKSLADHYHIDLLGGDTVSTKESLILSVTALGLVEEDVRLLRANARPGDVVFVTGELGNSAAGLHYLLQEADRQAVARQSSAEMSIFLQKSIKAHQQPVPHLTEGRILAHYARGSNIALNDVSDGIASEAHEIAQSSEVTIIIEKDRLPVDPLLFTYANIGSRDPYEWILTGGEDYVLIGTLPPSEVEPIRKRFEQEKCTLHLIGYVEEGDGTVWLKEQGELLPLPKSGYNHFASKD